MEENNVMEDAKVQEYLKNFFAQYGIKVKKLSEDELKEEVLAYLKECNILTLATCSNNIPRATVLEYRNDKFNIYIGSEGGGKFANLKVNNKVSFTIASPYTTFFSCRGIQGWGKAEVYEEGTAGFEEGMKVIKPERALAELGMKEMPSVFRRRVIKIIPEKIKYSYLAKGIMNAIIKF
ncbi:MAG: pyridoxamine 5'-phosphate oxidase family protein [Methanobacteriota archaeon]|nr:MAG: pyridoxamine 5'-phosphate oxidase family protein [Euryarchaeota archaeon]